MDVDDRKQVAEEAGYVLLSEDDGQEIYGSGIGGSRPG